MTWFDPSVCSFGEGDMKEGYNKTLSSCAWLKKKTKLDDVALLTDLMWLEISEACEKTWSETKRLWSVVF